MPRVRQLARHRAVVAAVLTLCAGLTLSACRSDPSVAAYVGSETLAESDVDEVIDNAEGGVTEGTKAPTREAVVTTFVLTEVCEKLRAAKPFDLAPVTAEQVAHTEMSPLDSEFTKARVAMYSCIAGVDVAEVTEPSEAELRDLYDRAKAAELVTRAFEEIKDELAADPSVRQAITVSRTLTSMVEAGDVSVNPRYRPLEFPISDFGTGAPLVVVPMGEAGSDAVRDA
jgi:hypothetical protein